VAFDLCNYVSQTDKTPQDSHKDAENTSRTWCEFALSTHTRIKKVVFWWLWLCFIWNNMSILNVNIRVAFINFDISVVTESIKQNRTLRGW